MGLQARDDLPFYAGEPAAIGGRGWALLLTSVAVAFAALVLMPAEHLPASLLAPVLFAGIPLAMLAALVGSKWTALFRLVGLREIGLMLVTALVTVGASAIAALFVQMMWSTAPNPAVTSMASMTPGQYLDRLLPTAPQLLGEELLTILPFLALLWFATQRLLLSRTVAIVIALVGSTALFAAAHLPTYQWHVPQCFGVIGTARLVLTLSYIVSRNLWVSAGAHILNDWGEFTLVFGLSHLPINTE